MLEDLNQYVTSLWWQCPHCYLISICDIWWDPKSTTMATFLPTDNSPRWGISPKATHGSPQPRKGDNDRNMRPPLLNNSINHGKSWLLFWSSSSPKYLQWHFLSEPNKAHSNSCVSHNSQWQQIFVVSVLYSGLKIPKMSFYSLLKSDSLI